MKQTQIWLSHFNSDHQEGFWKIPSKSEKGKFHEVRLLKDGKFQCDCVAGQMKQICSHVRKVKNMLTYLEFPDECWYCKIKSTARGLSEHHLWRGKDRSTSPTIFLCNICHDRATIDADFAKHLQEIWEQKKNSTQQ